ncbi:MAG: tripartite tricarboxylate transporter substrate-binding protein [Deltaproteobacteria bacterium]|nr:tripartite tricarboxylate transporter substrate-binding protein [Deltaproteobacteria bacterium]
MRKQKADLPIIFIMVGIIGLSIFMLADLAHFESHVAGTVGPGIFPLFILVIVMAMAVLIAGKAFFPPEYKLLSPFPSGSGKGLIVNRIAGIFSKELKTPVAVMVKSGEGYFSAEYMGSTAAPDGKIITIITNEKPTALNFLGASKALEKFVPVMGVVFDPDILVTLSGYGGNIDSFETSRPLLKLAGFKVGFFHSADFPYHLREALEKKGFRRFESLFFDDPPEMLGSLKKGGIQAGFCPLTHFLQNEELCRNFEIRAILSPTRLPALPNIPTFQELGVDLISGTWAGLGIPKNTDLSVITRKFSILSKPENKRILEEEIKERREIENIQGPEEFGRLISKQMEMQRDLGGVQEEFRAEKDFMSLYRVLGAIGLFLLFILVYPLAGFIPISFSFLTALSILLYPWRIRPALPRIVMTAVAVTAAVYVIFSLLFNVVFS